MWAFLSFPKINTTFNSLINIIVVKEPNPLRVKTRGKGSGGKSLWTIFVIPDKPYGRFMTFTLDYKYPACCSICPISIHIVHLYPYIIRLVGDLGGRLRTNA